MVPRYNGPFAFGSTGITTTGSTFYDVQPVPSGLSYSGSALLGFMGAPGNTLTLSQPVTAFGTYIDNAGDDDGMYPTAHNTDNLSLLLQNTADPLFSETITIGQAGPDFDTENIFYFGVTDAAHPFDEITLQGIINNPDGDGVLLDNTTVGFAAPVPEPSSIALVCCSLLVGLALFVRRALANRGMATVPACGQSWREFVAGEC